ncbi:MAG: protein translocase subunit SecD [Bdellovibrionota bacterium]
MNSSGIKFRVWFCGLLTVATFYFLAPTVWTLWHPDDVKTPSWMMDTAMPLGLDLKGGVHMVLGVDLDKVELDQLGAYGRNIERMSADKKIELESVKLIEKSGELEVKLKSPADAEKFRAMVTDNWAQTLELLRPVDGVEYLRASPQAIQNIRETARNQSIETIRNRIDEFGVAEPLISRRGEDQILVQFPGAKEPDRLKTLIGQTAQLNFQIVEGCDENTADCIETQRADLEAKIKSVEVAGNYTKESFTRFSEYRDRVNSDLKDQLPANSAIAFEKGNDPNEVSKTVYIPVLLSTKNIFSGEFIDQAFVQMSSGSNGLAMGGDRPEVAFHINAAAAKTFEQFTGQFVGHYMAIVLDGVVKSKPVLQSAIGDSGRITLGSGAYESMLQEAQDLSIVLRAGALPASIEVQEERVIGPSMGRDAIESGKTALIWSFFLVLAFMAVYYGLSGVIASIVTLINVSMIFAILGALHATLTLPGIAGIVLTLGMAVDALIIIFERMREEVRAGKTVNQVIELGFDKAYSAILDSNITTIIGAMVLLSFGTGSIRGFAFTLMVGIASNVFMATYFTKTIFMLFMKNKKTLSIGMSRHELNELATNKG